ncbi:MAG: GDP-mannose 4,6-dehydratase [Acidobacteria bacterium]|nr:GDP-mannose 4,6-dehydratase [Acidobacteriota bacterium]
MTEDSPNRRALITGVTGQDGSYLAELLLAKGYDVWGVVRRSSTMERPRIDHLHQPGADHSERFQLVYGDLGDASSLFRIVEEVQPDEVYNLAAQSHVQVSFDTPEYTADVTGMGVARLLEALRSLRPEARFYQASSSEMYGKVVETPQSETTRFHPRSPYAAAKVFAFELTRNYREAYGMYALNGILFNHESPRRGENFVTRKITRAAARIKLGLQDQLRLGNLDAKRDWGFAGDYVEGMWRMLQADVADDYVLATGETNTVRLFCEHAFARLGMPLTWEGSGDTERGLDAARRVVVAVDPRYYRPAEVDLLLGDPSRARDELGWVPEVGFQGLVEMMVDADLALAEADAGRSARP